MFIYSWNIFTGSIPEVWIELEKRTKKKKKENVKSLFIKLRTIEYEARRE